MNERKDDGFTEVACQGCFQRFHKTDKVYIHEGKNYHRHHLPQSKPVTLNALTRPRLRQSHMRFQPGLTVH